METIKKLEVISLGLGVQSTTMYYMSSMGILPRADYAIFADTGAEKKKTLEYLKGLLKWQKNNKGIPIVIVKDKNLYKDILDNKNSTGQRFSSIPAFTKNDDGSTGMLRRQCTLEYKIRQVDKAIRKLYGLKPRERNIETVIWKGITVDEVERASLPSEKWKIFYYPFLQLYTSKGKTDFVQEDHIQKMYRSHCIEWLLDMKLPVPPKSSCFFCPYMNDKSLLDMKLNEPSDWKKAVRVDKALRNSTKKGIKNPVFIHNSCVPLSEVVFSNDPHQTTIEWGECSGNCHN